MSSPIVTRLEELTILRQQVIRASNDELVDLPAELFQLRVTLLLLLLSRVGISTPEDLRFEVLLEVQLGAEVFRIGEVQQCEIFGQIVLNRCTGQDDTSLHIQGGKGLEGESILDQLGSVLVCDRTHRRSSIDAPHRLIAIQSGDQLARLAVFVEFRMKQS